MSRRSQWRDAVRAAVFQPNQRVLKATLLCLPVTANGEMEIWRDKIADETGLPLRTINRHLARACDAGWLLHETHGGHGRPGRYVVQIPV